MRKAEDGNAKDLPTWVTPRVVHGGFVPGESAAGGELLSHERLLADRLGLPRDAAGRASLNAHFLSDDGIAELQVLLKTGRYRVGVPEEGALLTIAWLIGRGRSSEARALRDVIGPFLDRLRFFPIPHSTPLSDGAQVQLQTIPEVIASLERIRDPGQFLREQETARVWHPLTDRLVALFLETVEGERPAAATAPGGGRLTRSDGRWQVAGGWPCQVYPEGWRERARVLLDEATAARRDHALCRRPDRAGGNLERLLRCLKTVVDAPEDLSGREVAGLRATLAGILEKRGSADSGPCRSLRAGQLERANRPKRKAWASVMAHRFSNHPEGTPFQESLLFMHALTAEEADAIGAAEGGAIPEEFRQYVYRCMHGSVTALKRFGVITSDETVASLRPQRTAEEAAAQLPDVESRRLHRHLYRAFRYHRSLLSLPPKHGVKLSNLPWVAALAKTTAPWRGD